MRVITLILVTAFILGFSCEDRKKGKVDDTIHLPPESPTPTPTLNHIIIQITVDKASIINMENIAVMTIPTPTSVE